MKTLHDAMLHLARQKGLSLFQDHWATPTYGLKTDIGITKKILKDA